MADSTRAIIDNFLSQRRIAFVGVSRSPRAFSRTLFKEFRTRGYDVVPVNPNASEIEGIPCFAELKDIQPPADAALVMTSRDATYRVLVDCEKAGIRRVWVYGINGPRGFSAGATEFCAAQGIALVPGYCPFMFLPDATVIHRCHRGIMKLMGSYPA